MGSLVTVEHTSSFRYTLYAGVDTRFRKLGVRVTICSRVHIFWTGVWFWGNLHPKCAPEKKLNFGDWIERQPSQRLKGAGADTGFRKWGSGRGGGGQGRVTVKY